MLQKQYLCIDLKSFFASVECVERGLDPMTTNLVVADAERGRGTICLAVTPAMKSLGVKNRCRVFEIPEHLSYIMASPRMQKYIDYAAEVYAVYLSYISPEDIHVYSIDEAFIDVTQYIHLYNVTAKELAMKIMSDIYEKLLEDLKSDNKSSPIFTHDINYINKAHYKRETPYEQTEPNQIVVDYIASMTDDYFIDLYAHLFPESDLKITYKGYFD
jgi:hypothetical protein